MLKYNIYMKDYSVFNTVIFRYYFGTRKIARDPLINGNPEAVTQMRRKAGLFLF